MKIMIILVFLLLMPFVYAERISLSLGDSYVREGRNITLIDLTKDKALICVNNEINIFGRSKEKTINKVKIEVRRINEDSIEADIKIDCQGCECGDTCNNLECFNQEEIIEESSSEPEEIQNIKNIIEEKEDIEIIDSNGISSGSIVAALFILIILMAGFYYLIKKNS